MTSVSKNLNVNKLNDITTKYNKACHRTIKMKSVDVKVSIYIDLNNENGQKITRRVLNLNVLII